MRLKQYDYRIAGYYFITAVTGKREPHFGEIESLTMKLSEYGNIAADELVRCSELRENVFIDEYIIMPDHVHFILIISKSTEELENSIPGDDYFSAISPKSGSLSAVVRSYKSAVTKRCHETGLDSFTWQRGFYDRIIRNQIELDSMREYIIRNPIRWGRKQII